MPKTRINPSASRDWAGWHGAVDRDKSRRIKDQKPVMTLQTALMAGENARASRNRCHKKDAVERMHHQL